MHHRRQNPLYERSTTCSTSFAATTSPCRSAQPAHPPLYATHRGKVERVIQTLLREWVYVQTYPNSLRRALALRPYLAYCNAERPHAALGFRSPPVAAHFSEPLHQQQLEAINLQAVHSNATGRGLQNEVVPPSRELQQGGIGGQAALARVVPAHHWLVPTPATVM